MTDMTPWKLAIAVGQNLTICNEENVLSEDHVVTKKGVEFKVHVYDFVFSKHFHESILFDQGYGKP